MVELKIGEFRLNRLYDVYFFIFIFYGLIEFVLMLFSRSSLQKQAQELCTMGEIGLLS